MPQYWTRLRKSLGFVALTMPMFVPFGMRKAFRRLAFLCGLLLFGGCVAIACSAYLLRDIQAYPESPQFENGRFRNPVPRPPLNFWNNPKLMWTFFFDKPAGTVPQQAIPVIRLTQADLLNAADNSVFRLGHSTLLFKINGKFWLTDPVFAERVSPLSWFGPKRFHEVPIALEALPPLEAVILSHNHYDHLDHDAVRQLAGKTRHFIAPLGVGDLLVSRGIPAEKVQQLDWWQGTQVDGLRLIATPAQHFSGRGLRDSDKTLWCSWVIQSGDFRLFFSGDSGYFDGFKTIGDRYGPFDMAFMETGAYDPHWAYVHMLPEQTLQGFKDLRGQWLFPIHNGTFDLSLHAWNDPFERITALAAKHDINLATPKIGAPTRFLAPQAGSAWWRAKP
ncbi:MAG: hydrolase [Proteobacteria bacterium]|nr:hydrolase [Pseudomonadota bacterium]